MPSTCTRVSLPLIVATSLAAGAAHAQTPVAVTVAPVVVTATRTAADPFNLPMAVNVVDAEAISEGPGATSSAYSSL